MSFNIGKSGKPIDPENKHCIDCGSMRKDHSSMAHPFREVD